MGTSDDNRKMLQELLIAKFDNIEDTLKDHQKLLNSIDKTLSLQAESLDEHIRRTEAAEDRLELLEAENQEIKDKKSERKGMAKLIGWVALGCSTIYGVWKAWLTIRTGL